MHQFDQILYQNPKKDDSYEILLLLMFSLQIYSAFSTAVNTSYSLRRLLKQENPPINNQSLTFGLKSLPEHPFGVEQQKYRSHKVAEPGSELEKQPNKYRRCITAPQTSSKPNKYGVVQRCTSF